MGSSGYGFDIEVIDGRTPAPSGVLYEAFRVFLVKQWKAAVSKPQLKMAKDWILQGEDSLLTLGDEEEDLEEPATRLLFMFYETVDWPQALAYHWLYLALVCARTEVEALLEQHGYQVVANDYPSEKHIDDVFIVASRKIGQPGDDGVFWQYPESDFTDYNDLPKKTKEMALAARDKKVACACPYCVHLGRGAVKAKTSEKAT